jgi:hypothetical protein
MLTVARAPRSAFLVLAAGFAGEWDQKVRSRRSALSSTPRIISCRASAAGALPSLTQPVSFQSSWAETCLPTHHEVCSVPAHARTTKAEFCRQQRQRSWKLDTADGYTAVQNALRVVARPYDQGFEPGLGSRIMQKSCPSNQQTVKPDF